MSAEAVLRAVLALLAGYHLAMGLTAAASPALAARVAGWLYALEADSSAGTVTALRYGTRMLGLYALTLGALLTLATMDPARYVAIAFAVAGLQLLRAGFRVGFRHEVATAFRIPPGRNMLNVSLLIIESAVIIAAAIATIRG